jgi:peptidoglycan/xylan/chitin deacetylase (PgdA/CDA1 family)
MEMMFSGLAKQPGELLVLNYHGTQKKYLSQFAEQLDLLGRHFEFATIADVKDHFDGKPAAKPKVFLTFDDGILNNLRAAEILQQRNIQALFLVVPAFVDCPREEQTDFFIRNIRPVINPALDHETEDTTAMSWNDLQKVISMGHGIGSHSMTHTMIQGKSDTRALEYEIVESKQRIMDMLQTPVEFFCSPSDSLLSCGPNEMKYIRQHYRYFLSTFPGSNITSKERYFIKRSNVEAFWLTGTCLNAIGNWDQQRWKSKIREFDKVLANSR